MLTFKIQKRGVLKVRKRLFKLASALLITLGVSVTGVMPGGSSIGTSAVSVTKVQAAATSGTCGKNAKWAVSGSGSSLTLTISGSGSVSDYVTTDQPWVSYRSKIKVLNIKSGITEIGTLSFDSLSNMTTVALPATLKRISTHAFTNCKSLQKVVIPNSVTYVGNGAFGQCTALKSAVIPGSVDGVARNMFAGCASLNTVKIGNGADYIGSGAFSETNIESIDIPKSVARIDTFAFAHSSLSSIRFYSSSAPEIAYNAFSGISCTAYYPISGNWTDSDKENYGGSITWKPWNPATGKIVRFLNPEGKIGATTSCAAVTGVLNKTWTGKTVKQLGAVVKYKGTKLTVGTDYYVKYSPNKNVGRVKMQIVGKGNYSGVITLYYAILPKQTWVDSMVNTAAGQITVKVGRRPAQVDGYKIMCSTDPNFKTNVITKVNKSLDNTTFKFSGLSKNKTYYFRVQTYKKANGKIYYAKWSAVKNTKVTK